MAKWRDKQPEDYELPDGVEELEELRQQHTGIRRVTRSQGESHTTIQVGHRFRLLVGLSLAFIFAMEICLLILFWDLRDEWVDYRQGQSNEHQEVSIEDS